MAVSAVQLPGNPFMVHENFSLTSNIFPVLQENSYCAIFIHLQTQENLNTPATVLTQCVYSILMPSQENKNLQNFGSSNLSYAVSVTASFSSKELMELKLLLTVELNENIPVLLR